jgi:hypothetical protein
LIIHLASSVTNRPAGRLAIFSLLRNRPSSSSSHHQPDEDRNRPIDLITACELCTTATLA